MTLNQVEQFVEYYTEELGIMIKTRHEKNHLVLSVHWSNTGYQDDKDNKEYLLNELEELTTLLTEKYSVKIENNTKLTNKDCKAVNILLN